MNLLIKAYYDKAGTFENVGDTFFGKRLAEAASRDNVSVGEFCCRALGYTADKEYSAEERMRLRKTATNAGSPEYMDFFPGKEGKKSALRANGLEPFFTKKAVKVDPVLSDIVQTVTNFLEHTDMRKFCAQETGEWISINDGLKPLKLCKDEKMLEEMLPSFVPLVKLFLNEAAVDSGAERSYAAAGKLVLVTDKYDTDLLAAEICRHYGRRSMTMSPAHYFYVMKNAPYYQLSEMNKTQAYLKMADLANVYGRTVAELIEYAGFAYVDQLAVYEHAKCFVYALADGYYLCVDPFDEQRRAQLDYVTMRDRYGINLPLLGDEVKCHA